MTKKAKIYNGKKDSFFSKWYWENWTATCNRMKLEYFLTAYIQINSKFKTRNYKTLRGKYRQDTQSKQDPL